MPYGYTVPYLVLERLRQSAITARRRDHTWRYLAWSVLAGLASGAMLALACAFVAILWHVSLWLAIPMIALMIAPLFADSALRLVVIPTGHHRIAYYLARISRPGTDPIAYALCVAARTSTTGRAVAWVEALRDTRRPLGDGEIAATGLLAAARGDAQTARELLRSLAMIVEDHPAVRELAGEWLACDAAARGAWRELVSDAAHARWPATPLSYLLEGIAARHCAAAGAPGALELWARWILAPRRRATRGLVAAALAIRSDAPNPDEAGDAGEAGDSRSAGDPAIARAADSFDPDPAPSAAAVPRAVAAQLAFETATATAAALALAVQAWDSALGDAATRTWLAQRARELDAPGGAVERAIDDIASAVTDALALRAETARLGPPAVVDGPVGRGVTRRLRHGRLDALEAGFARWAERRHDSAAHPPIDEWRAFVALWTAYNATVAAGGLELRRLAFPHAFSKASSMAVWLWNKREEYAVSHAISAWLLSEALAVGDAEAIELGHRNCALGVPTRLGQVQP
jgi:hypothetical protein